MRFSVAVLVPLAVLIAPVLSGTVKKVDHKDGHKGDHKGTKHVKGNHHKGRDNNGDVDSWTPSWTWAGSGKQCPSDSECGFKCPQQWPTTGWSGWKSGKYTPVTTGYVSKDTFELDCKNLCLAHEKCNSCQAFSIEEAAEEFICALFEELIDTSTWEEDCDDNKDGKKYYEASCWNSQS
ncbi:hypothetical protein EDD18DRAFT_1142860 [Armillaria luteobubalina]|uniref:Apple domain-containing protein n=1 Tax=Armillaria luteobubalina TaxID=153913 RepID=A0AA39TV61_9AGAR|nr:hypothetical protein EDD18DRAFT_1142860 [Armillaria luteobubalina]